MICRLVLPTRAEVFVTHSEVHGTAAFNNLLGRGQWTWNQIRKFGILRHAYVRLTDAERGIELILSNEGHTKGQTENKYSISEAGENGRKWATVTISDGGGKPASGNFGGTALKLCTHDLVGDIDAIASEFKAECRAPFNNGSAADENCRRPIAFLQRMVESEEGLFGTGVVKQEKTEKKLQRDAEFKEQEQKAARGGSKGERREIRRVARQEGSEAEQTADKTANKERMPRNKRKKNNVGNKHKNFND
jgi:hypothetical protein